jgi:hypothetical protein
MIFNNSSQLTTSNHWNLKPIITNKKQMVTEFITNQNLHKFSNFYKSKLLIALNMIKLHGIKF